MSSSSGSESESDIEISTNIPKKTFKPPPSPKERHVSQEPKKIPVKDMVHSALQVLNTKKGVSLYAIKKYMVETYKTDTMKINFYIKKYIKNGVEAGTIVQTKGVGASGSFRLAPVKKIKSMNEISKKVEGITIRKRKLAKPDKPKKEKTEKAKKVGSETDIPKKKTKKASEEEGKIVKTNKKQTVDKKAKETKVKEKKKPKITKESKKEKITKETKKVSKAKSKVSSPVPAKKSNLMKRKSVGSIIKPPKMKPKMRE